nr:U32 family peptidase [Chloroflexus sp.]
MEQSAMRKPEIMSPAGYWPQLHAAIEAGADAIYFGLTHFTARAKVGFTLDELPEVMKTLHRRGVKGYVTFNTLVFDHELRAAATALAEIAAAGADAIIVQDVGVAALARRIAPDLPIHGSTQMSITSAEGVVLAARYGVSRVVLARELSLAEVAAIRAHSPIELEIFVHGALCVSYSGQCFSSEAWGGRSANRGQCAQACRLPYDLIVDGQQHPLGAARYLLSPGDLAAIDEMATIARLGVSALKIEGRYKDAEYVAITTDAYRRALDAAWAGLPPDLTSADRLHLEQVYSRGLGPHFLRGTNHQAVVEGRAPRHRGLLMGRVVRVRPDAILIAPEPGREAAPLKPGDGVVFDAADWRSPEETEEGGRIFTVNPVGDGLLALTFAKGAVNPRRIRAGDLLWRTSDPQTERVAQPFVQPAAPVRRQPVRVEAVARTGAPLELRWTLVDRPDLTVTVQSAEPLATAQNRPLDEATLRDQLGRLGDTAYQLAELAAVIEGNPFAPVSLLNQLRRQAVAALAELQGQPPAITIHDPVRVLDEMLAAVAPDAPPDTTQIHLLIRSPDQLAAAIALRPASITLDYLDLEGLKPALAQVRAAGIAARIAAPRVLKPEDERVVRFLRKLDAPLLVRSTGLLEMLRDDPAVGLTGDFSLNAANILTADLLLGLGLQRLTLTHDLNAEQIAHLAERIGGSRLEAIAYHHLPVFHTEHCIFCRFLSNGTSYKDCGRPCERHRVALRDAHGRAHPVIADVGCRNTVFGAEAQEASKYLDRWRAAGIAHYRLEFVHESAAQITAVTEAFCAYLNQQIDAAELGRRWRQSAPQGVTEGSFFVPSSYQYIPLM